jgi:hypothetical protein
MEEAKGVPQLNLDQRGKGQAELAGGPGGHLGGAGFEIVELDEDTGVEIDAEISPGRHRSGGWRAGRIRRDAGRDGGDGR